MRVTGGANRGIRLKVPAGMKVRPTSDKVKQALFNILGDKTAGAAFLDLYAGAGGIGIEALSRGAGLAVFVDASRSSLDMVKRNIEITGFEDRTETVLSTAEQFLRKKTGHFDVVFLDPPYAIELEPVLEQIAAAGILRPGAVVVAEHFKKQQPPERAGMLARYRHVRYGDTVLAFYHIEKPERPVR